MQGGSDMAGQQGVHATTFHTITCKTGIILSKCIILGRAGLPAKRLSARRRRVIKYEGVTFH